MGGRDLGFIFLDLFFSFWVSGFGWFGQPAWWVFFGDQICRL